MEGVVHETDEAKGRSSGQDDREAEDSEGSGQTRIKAAEAENQSITTGCLNAINLENKEL